MTDSVLTYKDCYEQAQSLALEIIEDNQDECETLEDFMDKAWEYVDNHEWVIYYYKAHQFVDALPHEYYDAAEELVEELHSVGSGEDRGLRIESFNHYASLLAFHGLTAWVSEFIEKALEEVA